MKKAIWFLPLLLLLTVLAGCSTAAGDAEEFIMYGYDGSDEKILTTENEYLALDFFPDSTEFILRNKATGEEWRSNPEGGAEDALADATTKNLLQSQFSLTYANVNGVENTLTSYQYSVQKGLYEFEVLPNGFAVHYTVGNIERVYIIPYAVPESRMMEYYDQFERKDQRKIDEYYRKYDLDNLRRDDNKEQLLNDYPTLTEEPVYVLRDSNPSHIKVQLETLFESFGYTQEDYELDIARYNVEKALDVPVYNITVRYELEGKDFLVTVPFDDIQYKPDYPLTTLRMLPFFGCGGLEDEGYLFVPEGSGTLINFNNGKQNMDSLVTNIYGYDTGLTRKLLVIDNRSQMPVFGVQRNGSAMLCIIEDGATYAAIEADVSRRRSSFNSVLARYNLIRGETMDISSKSDKTIMLYQKNLPEGESITQRYTLCERDGYMGMAERYREYVIQKYGLNKLTAETIATAVEITGAVNKVRFIMGLPFDMPLKLTSYEEAEGMVEDIAARGWENVSYKLNGWFNKSVQHSVPSSINLIGDLGGKKDILSFADAVTAHGGDLYYEADFMFMKRNNLFDGFSTYTDAARYVSRERVIVYPYAISSYVPADWMLMSYLATPAYTAELIQNFFADMGKYGTTNIAFRNIGQTLASNYNEKDLTSREAAKELQKQTLSALQSAGSKTMVKAGNAYIMPFADFITDAALPQSAPSIADASIPFYEIVMHALVPLTGGSINLASDYSGNLLRTVESGAGIYFSFINEEALLLQDTLYYEYYANQYELWIDEADSVYKRLSADFNDCANQYITDHVLINANVTKTVYENGKTVVVNHGTAPFSYEGVTIAARDYVILKGGNAS